MAYRSSSINTGSSVNIVGNAPAGLTDNDWMLAFIVVDGTKNVTSAPAGWNLLLTIGNIGPDSQSAWIYEKVASSEGASWQWVIQATAEFVVIVGCWSGRNTAGSLVAQGTQNNASLNSVISVDLDGVTASSGDDIAWFAQLDQIASTEVWGFTAPGSYTERQDGQAPFWITATLATRDNVSAGATGVLTGSATRSGGSFNSGFSGGVIVLPLSGGGGAQIVLLPQRML